jgi:hypothetical protein
MSTGIYMSLNIIAASIDLAYRKQVERLTTHI